MDAIVLAGGVAQVFPVVTGAVARRRLTAGRAWVVGWGVYSTVTTALSFALRHGSNLWIVYFSTPLEGSLILLALSCWQERPLYRKLMRWAVPAAIALHVFAVAFLENRREFSIASVPSYAIIGLVAALFTFVDRSLATTDTLVRQDWFWVSGGLALYMAAWAVVAPLGASLMHDLPTLLNVYRAFNLINVIAYAAVAVGLLCPPGRSPRA